MYGNFKGSCEKAPTLLHGRGKLIVNDEGTEVSVAFSCEPGYQLHGQSQIPCDLDNDIWLGDMPACKQGKNQTFLVN